MKSERMVRVLECLKAHPAPSTKEIEDWAQVAAARDYIRRLRDAGHRIETIDSHVNGVRIVRYKLAREPIAGELFTAFGEKG